MKFVSNLKNQSNQYDLYFRRLCLGESKYAETAITDCGTKSSKKLDQNIALQCDLELAEPQLLDMQSPGLKTSIRRVY